MLVGATTIDADSVLVANSILQPKTRATWETTVKGITHTFDKKQPNVFSSRETHTHKGKMFSVKIKNLVHVENEK